MSQEVNLNKETVKNLIFRHYCMPVLTLKKVRGIYKSTTEQGCYGFKNAKEMADLPFIHYCSEYIKFRGFPYLPSFIPTLAGELALQYEGETYFLEQWINAREFNVASNQFERLAVSLADFHQAARGLIPAKNSHRYGWGFRPSVLIYCLSWINEWRKNHPIFQLTGFGQEMLDFLRYRCERAYAYVAKVSFTELYGKAPDSAVLCHGSLHQKNILIDSNENIWFIDLESLIYAERVLDLAQLLHYHAPTYNWDIKIIRRFIQSYESRLQQPILEEEWRCLLSYLSFPRRLLNSMFQYFGEAEPLNSSYLKLKKIIEQEWLKERFLKEFEP